MPKNKKKIAKISQNKQTPTLLLILDGFGLRDEKAKGNAITSKTAPNIFQFMKDYPTAKLKAHGQSVGLFKGQQGNSEAGHFNIGAGRIVKQDLVRISEAIDDGTFFKNEAFNQAVHHAQKYKSAVHVVGLLTDGHSAHAKPEHLYATLNYLRKKKQSKVFLHLFTDGRDSPPHSSIDFLHDLRKHLTKNEKIATICGRIYGMDRNKIWERTQAAYDLMVSGKADISVTSADEALGEAVNRGETDEYITPTVITDKKDKPIGRVQDNDVVFFFNARSDRARQITKSFVQNNFIKMNPGAFKRKKCPKNIRFVAMTDFGPDLPGIFTAFPSPDVVNSLPCAIGNTHKQLYISESEKYAHVTYFVNGGYAEAICGEERYLLRSAGEWNFKNRPEMNAKEVTATILEKIKKEDYTFITANIPNADMVGHTGDLAAAKKAVRCVDKNVAKLVKEILKIGGQILITADHGNAEMMINPKTGEGMTEHTIFPVPCIIIKKGLEGMQTKRKTGKLADIAPTLLKLMGIKKPKEMTGRSLL